MKRKREFWYLLHVLHIDRQQEWSKASSKLYIGICFATLSCKNEIEFYYTIIAFFLKRNFIMLANLTGWLLKLSNKAIVARYFSISNAGIAVCVKMIFHVNNS